MALYDPPEPEGDPPLTLEAVAKLTISATESLCKLHEAFIAMQAREIARNAAVLNMQAKRL